MDWFMVAMGGYALWLLYMGLSAAFAQWREKYPASGPPPSLEALEREEWETAVTIRRER